MNEREKTANFMRDDIRNNYLIFMLCIIEKLAYFAIDSYIFYYSII